MAQDPLSPDSNTFGPQEGPFTGILKSGLVPGSQQNNDRPSGFMGTTGKLAFFGSKILEGFQRGKMLSYAAEEAKRTSEFKQALSLYDSQIQRSETPEQRKAAEQKRDAFVLAHLQEGLNDTGKKKKPKKDTSEYPSRGGQALSTGTASKSGAAKEGVPEQLKGFLSNIVGNLAGPNLPHSGRTDLESVKANLYDIQQMPGIQAKSEDIHSQAAQLVAGIKAKGGTTEDIQADPGFQKIMEQAGRYLGPQQAKALAESMVTSVPTPEQKQVRELNQYRIEQAKRDEAEDKRAEAVGAKMDELAGIGTPAPPAAREKGDTSTPVAGYTPVAGASKIEPPEARPVPQESKTVEQKSSDKFVPGDTSHLFGTAVPGIGTPRYQAKYGRPAVAFVTKGNETMPLYSVPTASGGRVLVGADYRVFRTDQAEKEGWGAPQASRPVRPPLPHQRMGLDPSNKKQFIWYDVDPNTNQLTPAKDDKGRPIVAKVERDVATNAKQMIALGNDAIKTRDKELNAAKAAYDKKRTQMQNNVGEYQNFTTDKKAKDAAIADLDAKYQQQAQTIKDQAKMHIQILGQALHDANMVNVFGEKEQPEEAPESYAPDTLFGLGDSIGKENEPPER